MSREGDLCLQGVFVQEVSDWVVSVHSCFVQGGIWWSLSRRFLSGWSVHRGLCAGVSGGVCPGKGVSVQGVSVQVRGSLSRGGVSNRWVLYSFEGSVSRGGSLSLGSLSREGGLHRGGHYPGGFCLGGLSTGVFVQGVSGGLCPGEGNLSR